MINRRLYRNILIPLSFLALLFFTINFQNTLWFGFFGSIPNPVLWPSVFVYLMTNRDSKSRIGWMVVFLIVICSHTVALPLHILLSLVSLAFLIRFTQKRFSAIDTTDLMAFSFISTILFPFLYSIFSLANYEHTYYLWRHALNALLTIPFIPMVLYVCRKLDRLFHTTDEGILLGNNI